MPVNTVGDSPEYWYYRAPYVIIIFFKNWAHNWQRMVQTYNHISVGMAIDSLLALVLHQVASQR